MDNGMASGVNVTVVGVTTVFLALTLLVTVLSVLSRILNGKDTVRYSPTPTEPADGGRSNDDRLLELVAAAAYGLHATHRVTVAAPAPPSPWLKAGRARQVQRFPKRS